MVTGGMLITLDQDYSGFRPIREEQSASCATSAGREHDDETKREEEKKNIRQSRAESVRRRGDRVLVGPVTEENSCLISV